MRDESAGYGVIVCMKCLLAGGESGKDGRIYDGIQGCCGWCDQGGP